MARFDVFTYEGQPGYLLDVQADLLDGLNTRIVVPLMAAADAPPPARQLNPIFDIDGAPFVMVTQFLAAVPLTVLGPRITSLAGHDMTITAALDLALTGV